MGRFVVVTGTAFDDMVNGVIINGGGIEIVYGNSDNSNIENGGLQVISAHGDSENVTVSSGGSVIISSGGAVSDIFLNSGATLTMQSGASVDVETIDVGGTIIINNFAYSSDDQVTLNTNQNELIIKNGSSDINIAIQGDYTEEYFNLSAGSPDASSTLITLADTPCYCRGTRVLTDCGEIAVEDLQIGNRLVTRSGALRPIRWIGRRSYSGHFAADNRTVLPIQFRPNSLGDGLPRRDLFVSPQHAMFLDGMLVPAAALVNGVSIVQAQGVEQVEYFHLELDTHEVILAEGAPSETFVDDRSRFMFHNAAEYAALYPDAPRQPARYCAPRLEDGPVLEALRRRLAARAATPGRLQGFLEHVDRGQIRGWAKDESGSPVQLQILDNGVTLGQTVADTYREDLEQAGIRDGRHSFTFTIPGGLSPHTGHAIEVRRVSDDQPLEHSPWALPAEASRAA